VLKNIHFKQFVLTILSLGFLTTNVGYTWAALPCTPNCESENSTTDGHHSSGHHHANMSHEPAQTDVHSNDTHNISMNSVAPDACDCNECNDFYEALFSYLLAADIDITKTVPLLAVENLDPNSNSHIPDPYRAPPA